MMLTTILKNLKKEFPDGFKLIIREDGSGIVKSVPYMGEGKILYDFDTLAELLARYG